mmetsp:Transcript_578/g.1345  ORF Transcript_578/g.1345 Transcript_578/m.1345 type:complete len:84 (+) Transcript_578:501-752(+)
MYCLLSQGRRRQRAMTMSEEMMERLKKKQEREFMYVFPPFWVVWRMCLSWISFTNTTERRRVEEFDMCVGFDVAVSVKRFNYN